MSKIRSFWPDRSLRLAIVIVTGMTMLGAGGVYLFVEVAAWVPVSPLPRDARIAKKGFPGVRQASRRQRMSTTRRVRSGRRRSPDADPLFPLATPAPSVTRFEPTPPPPYASEFHVDLSHARLDGPAPGPSRLRYSSTAEEEVPSSSSVVEGVEFPTGVDTGTDPQGERPWRSAVEDLNRSLHALDGTLAALNRTEERQSSSSTRYEATKRQSASGPTPPGRPDPVPLGGAGWLAAAGAAYAVRRLRKENRDGADGGL